MTRTWGGLPAALSVSAARCSTPKRCCSSTTTSPRSANWTLSSRRAWVPMTIPDSPLASRDIGAVRWVLVSEPVSSSTPVPSAAPPSMPPAARSPMRAVIARWCCWASTSVGASSAAWPPESTTRSIARSATRVLPDPTSPWRSRFIGWASGEVGLDLGADRRADPRSGRTGSRASKAASSRRRRRRGRPRRARARRAAVVRARAGSPAPPRSGSSAGRPGPALVVGGVDLVVGTGDVEQAVVAAHGARGSARAGRRRPSGRR